MSVDSLKAVLAPPTTPAEVPSSSDFAAFEKQFTKMPTDFVDFLRLYGTGVVDSFIWIFNPASQNPNLNLVRQAKLQLDVWRELQASRDEVKIYRLFPEKDGLLPFGITDNGDVLFWKTSGSPQEWSIVIADSRAPRYEEHKFELTDFLSNLLTKRIRVMVFPEDMPSERPTFVPTA